jgi:phospholipase C
MRANQGSPNITKVFFLMLENRSFDHMLGFSGIDGTDAVTGGPTKINGLSGDESNSYRGVTYTVNQPADLTMSVDPGHDFVDTLNQLCGDGHPYPRGGPYPSIDNSGFVASYAAHGGGGDPGRIMRCYRPDQLPVLNTLAREFAVCDSWFCSMPGPTWPNRFFVLAGTSGGLDHAPSNSQMAAWMAGTPNGLGFESSHIFTRLTQKGYDWRIYRDGFLAQVVALKGIGLFDTLSYGQRFARDIADAHYPAVFTFIEPNYGDIARGTYAGGSSQHPLDDVTGGEALIKTTYEAIRASPHWGNSLLIITWDEHGGFYDHVAPSGAVPPGDTPVGLPNINQYGFTFEQYGPRVAAVIVSAHTARNTIDHTPYDHTSVLATLEAIFGLDPLTQRDANANDVTLLTSLPSARTDTPATLPQPARQPSPALAPTAIAPPAAPDPNLWLFLYVAMQSDVDVSPDTEESNIRLRVQQIVETGDTVAAQQYIQEVQNKVAAQAGS